MSASRARPIAFVIIFSLTLVVGLVPAAAAAAPDRPSSMAATGDSITRAFNLCFFPFTDCPARSWSTGNNSSVNSHARRLGITGSAYNDAVSGAKMVNLPTQMGTVFSQNVGYVTVLMGGNDVCTDTETQMTDPGFYETKFREAMNTLAADLTPPLVYVVSTPNVKMLWEILKDNSSARSAWNSYNTCQSLLANPLSTAQVDVDRRERVKQRNMELNQRLRAACSAYAFCRSDGEASFGTAFVPNDVSTRDYFHPSTAGQTKTASVSYDYGYWGTKGVNGAPTAAFTASCLDLTCMFTDESSDPQSIGSRSWNLDGVTTSVLQNPRHTFAAAGTYKVTLYAIDALGATASVTHPVTVTSDGGGGGSGSGTLAGTVTAAPGGPIAGATVTIGTATVVTGSTGAYSIGGVPTGTYSVTASADGHETQQKTATITEGVTTTVDFALNATSTSEPSITVASLSPSGSTVNRNNWRATVEVTVKDTSTNGTAVSGATVAGNFSAGGSKSCTTDSSGICRVTSDNIRNTVAEVTFTVTEVTHATLTYDDTVPFPSVTVNRPPPT